MLSKLFSENKFFMLSFNIKPFRKKIDHFPVPKNYVVIEKANSLEIEKPIFLAGDLDKVISAPFGIRLEDEFKRFFDETYSSGPFYQYQLENVLILKNRIFFSNYEYLLNPLEKKIRVYNSNDLVEYEHASFSSMRISTVFFGHWLHEELLLIDYLQGKQNIVSSSPDMPQKRDIVGFFNLKYSVNPLTKIQLADMYHGWQHTTIYKNILADYKKKISVLAPTKRNSTELKIVYLKRGLTSVKRNLQNEEEVLIKLSKHFDVSSYIAETTPIQELYTAIYSADIILGIEGSQLAHGIVAGRAGAILACIQPPRRFYNPFKTYCADAGMRYAVFVAEQCEDKDSFSIDLDRLKQFLIYVENCIQ